MYTLSQLLTIGLLATVPLASAYPTRGPRAVEARDDTYLGWARDLVHLGARHHTEAQIGLRKG